MHTFHHKKESKILKLIELLNDKEYNIKRIKLIKRLRTQHHFRISWYKAVDRNIRDYSIAVMLLYVGTGKSELSF